MFRKKRGEIIFTCPNPKLYKIKIILDEYTDENFDCTFYCVGDHFARFLLTDNSEKFISVTNIVTMDVVEDVKWDKSKHCQC